MGCYFHFFAKMSSREMYKRGRHFKLNPEDVLELIFADQSDDEVGKLDDEDINVLGDALDENREAVVIGIDSDGGLPGPAHEQLTTSGSSSERTTVNVPHSTSRKRRFQAASAFAGARANAAAAASGDKRCPNESDDDEIPTMKKLEKSDLRWTSKARSPLKPAKDRNIPDRYLENGTAFHVYAQTCDLDNFINLVVTESNRYAHQQGLEYETDAEEMKAFFGILLLTGFHELPSTRHYWSTDPKFGVDFVHNIMTLKRFESIKRCLHFNDNITCPKRESEEFDRAYKIRPVLDHFNKAFQAARKEDVCQSIDERIVKFKGHNIMRQYVKGKPVRWGFKLWLRCGSKTGYTYEMDLYTGKKDDGVEVGLGENVVLKLCRNLVGTGVRVFMDNFFSSPYLMRILHDNGLEATGTVRGNRKGMPKSLKADKDMDKGEMTIAQATDRKVSVLKWMDKRGVIMITNAENVQQVKQVSRRQKNAPQLVEVEVPSVICTYNNFMGGVDLADQLKGNYAIDIRSRYKYYLRVVFDIFDTTIVNGFIQFVALNPNTQMTHLDFRAAIVDGLVGSFSSRKNTFPSRLISKRVSLTRPVSTIHLPKVITSRKRCKLCYDRSKADIKSRFFCEACGAAFCLQDGRNCFFEHHNN